MTHTPASSLLALTQGEPAGIGPEIIWQAFAREPTLMRGCLVVGDVTSTMACAIAAQKLVDDAPVLHVGGEQAERHLADLSPSDLLAVAATGAYCYSLSSNYNYLTRPAMVAVSRGTARLIVRGETEADMFSRDLTYQARVNSAAAGNGN